MPQRKRIGSDIKIPAIFGNLIGNSSISNNFYIEELRCFTDLDKKLIDERYKILSDATMSPDTKKDSLAFIDGQLVHVQGEMNKTHADYNKKEEGEHKNNTIIAWAFVIFTGIDIAFHIYTSANKS